MRRFLAVAAMATMMQLAALPAAMACSPLPPLTIDDLAALPDVSDNFSHWIADPNQNPPVAVYERLHYDFIDGTQTTSSTSLSAVVRYWGRVPADAGLRKHGGVTIDPTDTCGAPSGRTAGTSEYVVEFADGMTAELSVGSGDDVPARLAPMYGAPVDVADRDELLALPGRGDGLPATRSGFLRLWWLAALGAVAAGLTAIGRGLGRR